MSSASAIRSRTSIVGVRSRFSTRLNIVRSIPALADNALSDKSCRKRAAFNDPIRSFMMASRLLGFGTHQHVGQNRLDSGWDYWHMPRSRLLDSIEPESFSAQIFPMNNTHIIILAAALAFSLFGLTSCDGKVSEDAARKAGEILKKWQDQNRGK